MVLKWSDQGYQKDVYDLVKDFCSSEDAHALSEGTKRPDVYIYGKWLLQTSSQIDEYTWRLGQFALMLGMWRDMISSRDDDEAKRLYDEVASMKDDIDDERLLLIADLIEARYLLMLKETDRAMAILSDREVDVFGEAATQQGEVYPTVYRLHEATGVGADEFRSNVDVEAVYYFYKYRALGYQLSNNFTLSYDGFLRAQDVSHLFLSSGVEKGDLNYSVGVTGMRNHDLVRCVECGEVAVELFRRAQVWRRVADSYVLLGLVYKRLNRFLDAHRAFDWARSSGEWLCDRDLLGRVFNNLGELYEKMFNDDEAVRYYMKAFHFKRKQDRLVSVYSILSLLRRQEEFAKMRPWVDVGLQLYAELGEHDVLYPYYLHIKSYDYLIAGDEEVFVDFVADVVIPYFEEKLDYYNVGVYARVIGLRFMEMGDAERGARYLILSQESLDKVSHFR
ncbi:hypothetical protein [Texcoconibacillus texcoconensis]|uniref:Tetratricopeptide (TPR) repeat protein n=1 Tax=Texcoconibacillus texcoconensis TaxID=1095777 RepID=A0A840QTH6_9BACI|nr:hypothetical protein [Texcoconibacillus texcoconensis]MBB5174591.1 tetratricopeptide (TPR) repeat protein [Texcoconibacillus texcoconensis]